MFIFSDKLKLTLGSNCMTATRGLREKALFGGMVGWPKRGVLEIKVESRVLIRMKGSKLSHNRPLVLDHWSHHLIAGTNRASCERVAPAIKC